MRDLNTVSLGSFLIICAQVRRLGCRTVNEAGSEKGSKEYKPRQHPCLPQKSEAFLPNERMNIDDRPHRLFYGKEILFPSSFSFLPLPPCERRGIIAWLDLNRSPEEGALAITVSSSTAF